MLACALNKLFYREVGVVKEYNKKLHAWRSCKMTICLESFLETSKC